MKTEDYLWLENEYGARNYNPLDVVLTRGRGGWVWRENDIWTVSPLTLL
jgi:ornithine--oxo-acid transaminase